MNQRRYTAQVESGFTVIELIVVTATISVLSAIALPQYMSYTARANDQAAHVLLKSIATAEEAYYVDNFSYIACTEQDCSDFLPSVGEIRIGIAVSVEVSGDSYIARASHSAGTGKEFVWEG